MSLVKACSTPNLTSSNRKHLQHRKWSKEAMQKAYEDCKQRGLPCRTSSKKHGVPRTTLRDRLTRRVKPNCSIGRTTHLTEQQEKYLCDYLTFMSLQGFSVTVQQIINEAWAMDQNTKNAFGEKGPSKNWWFRFHQRHPEVRNVLSYPSIRDKTFSGLINNLRAYFQHLKAVLDKGSFLDRPEDIYYCDEVIVDQTKLTKQILIPRRMLYFHQVNSSEHFSIQCCVSAAGRSIPPFITFKTPLPHGSDDRDLFDGAVCVTHDTGLVNPELFLKWLQEVFVPTSMPRPDKPVLLLLDGHRTQCSIKVVEEAVKSNIILMAAAPSSSPLCQPLDLVMYKCLKLELETLMLAGQSMQGDFWISTNEVPKILKAYFNSFSVESDIQEGFKLCGIFPFNPNAVDKKQLGQNKLKVDQDVDLSIAPQLDANGTANSGMHYEVTSDYSENDCSNSLDNNVISFNKPPGKNFCITDENVCDIPNPDYLPGPNTAKVVPRRQDKQLPDGDIHITHSGNLAIKVDVSNTTLRSSTPDNEEPLRGLPNTTARHAGSNDYPFDSEGQISKQSQTSSVSKPDVSNTTLQNSTSDKQVKVKTQFKKTTALSSEKEKYLRDYVLFLSSKGFTPTSNHLIKSAWSVDQRSRLKVFGEKGPTKYWLKKLIKQHSEIKKLFSEHSLRKCETLFGAINNIRAYFQNLRNLLVLGKLLNRPQDIYYCDEILVNPHRTSESIIIPRRHLMSTELTSAEVFSILCCVSAAGRAMPPLFTFKSNVPTGDCSNSRTDSAAYDCQEFMNPKLFLKWFQRVFVPLSKPVPDKPILLLLDGQGSQCSPELLEDAAKSNVIVMAAAPQPITLQPLDVLTYKFLKFRLDKLAKDESTNAGNLWISKSDVPRNITGCFESVMSVYNIREGFKQCGIYPFNPNAVSTDQLPGIKLMPNGDETLDLCSPPLENSSSNARYATQLMWDRTYKEDKCSNVSVPPQCKRSTGLNTIKVVSSDQQFCSSNNRCVNLCQSNGSVNLQPSTSGQVTGVVIRHSSLSPCANVNLTIEPSSSVAHNEENSVPCFEISNLQEGECNARGSSVKHRLESNATFASLRVLPHRLVRLQDQRPSSGKGSCPLSRRAQLEAEPTAARKRKLSPPADEVQQQQHHHHITPPTLPAHSSCFDYADENLSCACFKCHTLWDHEPATLQSKWKSCQSMNCLNLICPRCLPPGFDYERDRYFCINSAMIKVQM